VTTEARPKGIPTTYVGTRFRSRLEARWAAFFDLVGWRWVYEPFDTDGWIPDFLVSGPWPYLVEVGPCISESEYVAKGDKARAAFPTTRTRLGAPGDGVWLEIAERWTLIAGVSPAYEEPSWRATAAGFWAVGGVSEWDPTPAFWYRCDECDAFGLDSPDYGGYLRPCGHAVPVHPLPGRVLSDLWATAGNRVQWRSR
jgi:hypothetical protein